MTEYKEHTKRPSAAQAGVIGVINAGYHKNRLSVQYLLFVAVLLSSLLLASCSAGHSDVDAASLRGGETRSTLSPAYFTGKAAAAYTAAREIPEILDSMECYCDCEKNFGHKSLLSCHVDEHSRYCTICMDEAITAHEMYKQGKDVIEIRTAIDNLYSRNR